SSVATDAASGGAKAGATAGPSFQEALGRARGTETHGIQGQAAVTGAQGHADPISALAQQVKSGQLSMDQALEHLIERATSGVGKHLSAAERDELREVVRNALSSDPTLAALRSEG